MDSFLFALNAVGPIAAMVAIGYLLKRAGLLNATFAKACNKLVFRVFLPCLLFSNIYKISSFESFQLGYLLYAAGFVFLMFLLGLPISVLGARKRERRGALWQSCFRSNFALVGIPLTQSLYGASGVAVSSLLSAITVPQLNVLAVISLSIFREGEERPSVRKILLDILKNPLIHSVVAGLAALLIRSILEQNGIGFRLSDIPLIMRVLEYLASLATPLALLMLGAQFEFSAISALRREILIGVSVRTVLAPALGLGLALLLREHFEGAHFASFLAAFATPVSVSSVPMAQEMHNDDVLAGQLVIWSTLVSGLTVFLATLLLRQIGIF